VYQSLKIPIHWACPKLPNQFVLGWRSSTSISLTCTYSSGEWLPPPPPPLSGENFPIPVSGEDFPQSRTRRKRGPEGDPHPRHNQRFSPISDPQPEPHRKSIPDPWLKPHCSKIWFYRVVLFFTNWAYSRSPQENEDGGCYPIPKPDEDKIFSISILVGTEIPPNPSPNRGIPHWGTGLRSCWHLDSHGRLTIPLQAMNSRCSRHSD
jgi:hypothetical protein